MLIIIAVAVITLILIIPCRNKSEKNSYNSGNKTIKITGKASFLSAIGFWLRKIMKGK